MGFVEIDGHIVHTSNINIMNKMQFAIGVKMIAFKAMTKGEAYKSGYLSIKEGLKMIEEEKPGYLVDYGDYQSWSPKDVFDNAYYPIEDPTKITRSDVEGFIVKGQGSKMGPKTTIVLDSTLTGFDTVATSPCVDPANYNQELGEEFCRKQIVDKIWGHLGFVLQWAKNGLKAKELKTDNILHGTAITKDEQDFYVIDANSIADTLPVPEELYGKVIRNNRFSWAHKEYNGL